jgi:ABC-type multidrug transport system ATPase subunit
MLGYLPQDFGLYPTLTAWQMLDYLAKLKGVTNRKERHTLIDVLLDRVNLTAERSQQLGGFSGGMRQRLGIAQALIGEPQLIIVDEPTAGLDPEERLRFHNLISESAAENTVVILSTHIVSDVSNLCSHMAIIQKGKIISTCTPRHAVDQLKESVWEGIVAREHLAVFKSEFNVISSRTFDGQARVRVISKGQRPSEEFTEATPVLEDYYFDLVNRQGQ